MKSMLGLTMKSVFITEGRDEMYLTSECGRQFKFYHEQDCCESVTIDDVVGDLNDLIGSPLTLVDKSSNISTPDDYTSQTWTFYKFATIKGYVDVKWLGESNGFYSESVDFMEVI